MNLWHITEIAGINGAHATSKKVPDVNQGANLAYQPSAAHPRTIIRLPNSRIGIEAPTALRAFGPVAVAGRDFLVQVELELDQDALRYKVRGFSIVREEPGGEIDPELLRQVRWGEIVSGAVDHLNNIVTFDEEGIRPCTGAR